jgi:hypothetical protein
LSADLATWLASAAAAPGPPIPSPIDWVSDTVGGLRRTVDRVFGVNQVVLEHTARSVFGWSDYLSSLDPIWVGVYCAVLLGAGAAREPDESSAGTRPVPFDAPPATGAAIDPAIEFAVEAAVLAAATADPVAWLKAARSALALDESAADAAAGAALRARLALEPIPADTRLASIVAGARRLAERTSGGPFECPAWLVELAIRRAVDEPGCHDHVRRDDMVLVSTQVAGLLDLHAALFGDGGGQLVYADLD